MKTGLLVFVFGFIMNFNTLYSQVENIATDRPDQSETPVLVEKGFFQIEAGASIEKVAEFESPIGTYKLYSHSYPSILLRYGISENVEFRLSAEFHQEEMNNAADPRQNVTGFSPITLGTKIKMFTEKGSFPETE